MCFCLVSKKNPKNKTKISPHTNKMQQETGFPQEDRGSFDKESLDGDRSRTGTGRDSRRRQNIQTDWSLFNMKRRFQLGGATRKNSFKSLKKQLWFGSHFRPHPSSTIFNSEEPPPPFLSSSFLPLSAQTIQNQSRAPLPLPLPNTESCLPLNPPRPPPPFLLQLHVTPGSPGSRVRWLQNLQP